MFDIYDHHALGQGLWRDDFTTEQAHEAAIACNTLHTHNLRIQKRIVEQTKEINFGYEWDDAIRENELRSDTEAYAFHLFDTLHIIHIGDCSEENECGCDGGTDCSHSWCGTCAWEQAKVQFNKGAKGKVTVKFGYSPVTVGVFTENGKCSELVYDD